MNSMYALTKMQDQLNMSFVLDNAGLANMCIEKLEREAATFKDMNNIVTIFLS